MNQNEFMRQQQAAVERMREMNSRAQITKDTTHKMPPVPSFVRLNENSQNQNAPKPKITMTSAKEQTKNQTPQTSTTQNKQNNSAFGGLRLPFLDSLLGDGDSTLILGLLLLLMSEKSDKLLLFALVYILL